MCKPAEKPVGQNIPAVPIVQVVESFEGPENGSDPDVLAQEIGENPEACGKQLNPNWFDARSDDLIVIALLQRRRLCKQNS
jgi:hypothetical protein